MAVNILTSQQYHSLHSCTANSYPINYVNEMGSPYISLPARRKTLLTFEGKHIKSQYRQPTNKWDIMKIYYGARPRKRLRQSRMLFK